MRPLSAPDAISPAWDHTRRLLYDPHDWRLALKIGLVAVFAQIGGMGLHSFGNHTSNLGDMGHHSQMPTQLGPMIAVIVGLAVVITAVVVMLALLFFYLGSRLQFVLFDVVLRRDTAIGPIWTRYAAATWRWMGLRLLLALAAFLCIAPVVIPAIIRFIHMLPKAGSPPPDVGQFIGSLIGLFATVFFVALLFGIAKILLHDFGLPSMALEGTSLGETVGRVWHLLRVETGQVLFYLVIRLVLGTVGSAAAAFVIIFGALIVLIPLGGIGLLAYLVLHHAGTAGTVFFGIICALLGLFYVFLIVVAAIILGGAVITFQQAYALYFLAGRYPLMAPYLEPFWPASHLAPVPPPYPPTTPPPAFSPPAV